MPLTRYPNGLTVNSTTALAYSTAATDGDLDCNRLFTAGTASIAGGAIITGTVSAASVVGNTWVETVAFSTASTAQTVIAGSPPDWATDLVGAFVTIGSVSAIVAAYTVRAGSAGTVYVSSENNGAGIINYGKDANLTIDTATVSTTSGIQCVRGVQGTAGDSYLTLVFRRTAA